MASLEQKFADMVKKVETGNNNSLVAGSCISTKNEGLFTKRKWLLYAAIAVAVGVAAYYAYRYYKNWKIKRQEQLEQVRVDDSKHDSTEWNDFFQAQENQQELPSTEIKADEPSEDDDPKFTKLSQQ